MNFFVNLMLALVVTILLVSLVDSVVGLLAGDSTLGGGSVVRSAVVAEEIERATTIASLSTSTQGHLRGNA